MQQDNVLLEFQQELKDNLTVFTANILAIEQDLKNAYLINELGRIAHNLKGATAILGFQQMSHLFHKVENIFDAVRTNRLHLDKVITTTLFEYLDLITELSDNLTSEGELYTDEQVLKIRDMEYSLDKLNSQAIPASAIGEIAQVEALLREIASLGEDEIEKLSISLKIVLSKLTSIPDNESKVDNFVNILNELDHITSQHNLQEFANKINDYKLALTASEQETAGGIESLSSLIHSVLDSIETKYHVDTMEELSFEGEEAFEEESKTSFKFTKSDLEKLKTEIAAIDRDILAIVQKEYTELKNTLKEQFDKNEADNLLQSVKLLKGTSGMLELSMIRQKAGEVEQLLLENKVVPSESFEQMLTLITLIINPFTIDNYMEEEAVPPVQGYAPAIDIKSRNPFQAAVKPQEGAPGTATTAKIEPDRGLRGLKLTGGSKNLSVYKAIDEAFTTAEKEEIKPETETAKGSAEGIITSSIVRSQTFIDECKAVDPEMAADFLIEFMGYRDELKTLLASYLHDSKNETLTRISKIGHTIKGSAGMAGLSLLSKQGATVEKLIQEEQLGLTHNARETGILIDMLDKLEQVLSPAKEDEGLIAFDSYAGTIDTTPAEPEPSKYIPAYQLLLQQENLAVPENIDYTKKSADLNKTIIQEKASIDEVKVEQDLEDIFTNIAAPKEEEKEEEKHLSEIFGEAHEEELPSAIFDTGSQKQDISNIIQQSQSVAPEKIESIIEMPTTIVQPQAKPVIPSSVKAEDRFIRLDISKIDDLLNLISGLYTVHTGLNNSVEQYMSMLNDIGVSITRLKELQNALDEQYSLMLETSSPAKKKAEAGGEFSELEMDQYTSMYRWTRELHESTEDIAVFSDTLRSRLHGAEDLLSSLLNTTNDLQTTTLKTRMGSLKPLSIKFTRYIRDLSLQYGKNINFVFTGDTLEVDKSIINQIEDPLLHMIKNSIDHGIESKEDRVRQGKSAQAQLKIEVLPQTDIIKIVVSDDGRGISLNMIRDKAARLGMNVTRMTEQDLINLIFMHGFSTAKEVSEISGRGIGMDVVKTTIDKLHGSIKVESKEGEGTRFELSIPNNVFTLKAMVYNILDEMYAMPYNNVVQTVGLNRDKIVKEEDGYYYLFRDGKIEILDITGLFMDKPFTPEMYPLTHGIIVNIDKTNYLVPTSKIIGLQNIQTKAFNPPLENAVFYSGASIDASGNIFLIVNIDQVKNSLEAARLHHEAGTRLTNYFTAVHKEQKKDEDKQTLLIVDDSLSIRNIVSKVVSKAGYSVITAKDGMEGLEAIRTTGAANIKGIILDVEMPRMTGYEMLAELRGDATISDVPVMMLTSRAGEKHKQRAIELGADGYVAKPYREEEFINLIKTVTSKRHTGNVETLVEI